MCGIAGTIGLQNDTALKRMGECLAHRGPDDHGIYWNEEARVGLAHRRLSIIDLSSAGHQPMSNEQGRIWVVFNGEIYNYHALRADLRALGYVFRSSSDTEVIVHGYAAYGEQIFERLDGMWAIALYDRDQEKVFLSRDPAGMKPLYVHKDDKTLCFASEISSLARELQERRADARAISEYLAHGYIMGPHTAYEGIRAVPPGAILAFELHGMKEYLHSRAPEAGAAPRDFADALSTFDRHFDASVRATLQADVPVGIFLSGGIDSALVARQASLEGAALRAFTIGFPEADFDESNAAEHMARHFGLAHTVHTMQGADVARDLDRIFDSFGQPFADTSALPTYYLAKLAREEGYKVALSGDGADELFGGYPTHYLPRALALYRGVPRAFDSFLSSMVGMLPERFAPLSGKEKATRFLLGARLPYPEAHARWKRVFSEEELGAWGVDTHDIDAAFKRAFSAAHASDTPISKVMQADFYTFLTWDCMVKSDICAMQNGVEVRMPFLNKTIVEFAWGLPAAYKVRLPRTKVLLRAALKRSVPPDLARLPKRGFVPPLGYWLCDDLRPAMLDLLSEPSIARIGFVDYTRVTRLIEEHLDHTRDHTKKLWTLMSLSRFYSRL